MTGPIVDSVDALAALVSDGAKIALYKGQGAPMALIRALIRRQVRDLHVVTVPTAGLSAELLIGAGCVATVETSGVTLDEFGQVDYDYPTSGHGDNDDIAGLLQFFDLLPDLPKRARRRIRQQVHTRLVRLRRPI